MNSVEELKQRIKELEQEAADHMRVEKTLRLIVEGTANVTGKDFLRSLVKNLAMVVGFRYAFVGEVVTPGMDRIRTLAVWADGAYGDNFEYDLSGTPCENVVGKSYCIYPKDVRQKFPQDHLLAKMGVESYMGTPLFDSSGNTIGILAALHDEPMEDVLFVEPILRIFAVRTVTEIERKRAEETLLLQEQKLYNLSNYANCGLLLLDNQTRLIHANETARKWFGNLEQIEGKFCWEIFKLNNPEKECSGLKVLQTGETVFSDTFTELLHGEKKSFYVIASPVKDKDDNILQVTEIVIDITERKRAEEERKQSFEKHQRIMEETVNALASALEKRDQYTSGHQHRVSLLASAIGQEMGLPKEQIEGIRIAGVLHDIGKIYIPAEILSKPNLENDLESLYLRTHPTVGYEILNKIEFDWPVAQAILQHHEKLDGTGYPDGIMGKDIILEAKILSVADVVEAMSTHRPYRPAKEMDEVLEEISQNRGILYDPEVVDACLKLFTEKGFDLKQPVTTD